MYTYLISIGYWFCFVVNAAVAIYVLLTWFPMSRSLYSLMNSIMDPLLKPLRKLVNQSAFRIRGVDISPIILYLLASYGMQIFMAMR